MTDPFAKARHLYEQGHSYAAVARMTGIETSKLQRTGKRDGWVKRSDLPPAYSGQCTGDHLLLARKLYGLMHQAKHPP